MPQQKDLVVIVILVGILMLQNTSPVYAGGAVVKRRQAGQQVAQRRAMQERAMQQAIVQRQALAQHAAQQAALQQNVHQTIQASGGQINTLNGPELQMHGPMNVGGPEGEVTQDILIPVPVEEPPQVKDIVAIEDLWKSFETTSENWPLIIDPQAKILTIERSVRQYKEKGITISKPASDYAPMIDGMSQENPAMLSQPFDKIMQFIAIMEYDFNNGVDKDQMAKKLLGDQGWKANRQRLGLDGGSKKSTGVIK